MTCVNCVPSGSVETTCGGWRWKAVASNDPLFARRIHAHIGISIQHRHCDSFSTAGPTPVKLTPGGGVAVAWPVVGPQGTALVSTGLSDGVVKMSSLDGGLLVPSGRTASTVVTYVVSGSRPVTGQLVGVVQVVVMHLPPPTGHEVMLYRDQGPPGGGVIATVAEVGLVGSTWMAGDLHHKARCISMLV